MTHDFDALYFHGKFDLTPGLVATLRERPLMMSDFRGGNNPQNRTRKKGKNRTLWVMGFEKSSKIAGRALKGRYRPVFKSF